MSTTTTTAPQPSSTNANTSTSTNTNSTPLPERYRTLMRLLPNPVVVCTALEPSHPSSPAQPRGMTMSSLTSLSLTPTPLLSFNIKKPSRTLEALRASGVFNVHVLADDQGGVRVAEWFSRGDAGRDPFEGVEGCGCEAVGSEGRVELRGVGVRRVLRCRVEELVGVRDHVIVVGEVEGIEGDGAGEVMEGLGIEGDEAGETREGLGLAYADRGYRRVGEVMRKHVEGK